ncbi:MAG: ABC transporter ATP-binding protein [Candidatus Ryanbacteria bacterium]|nr:ABC transporter ATP-binding protein [Candidatus Ryanbacteria bacterium]
MIRTEKLTKKFGSGELELVALKGINLQIRSGEFVAVVGPSGAGKSTLLYQLSLLDEPTSGEVFIDSIKTQTLSQIEKTTMRLVNLGYVFQDYALLPELTAAENVALPMLMQGLEASAAFRKAELALSRVKLLDKLHNLPSQLSGGQQQRVAIARAIAHEPKILFADEPTANLDTTSARPVIAAFQELHREGQTIVMVTHEEEYAALAERVVTLRDGVIVSDK